MALGLHHPHFWQCTLIKSSST